MYTLNSYKKLLSIGLFILCYQVLPAATLPFHARISTPNSANPVSIGLSSATTLVQVTAPWTGAFVDVAVQNKVTLGIDHQNMTFITLAGEIKVRVKLEQWAVNNTSNTPNTSTYQDLIIDYQPFNNSTTPYVDKSVFTFKGAYKFRITIDAITQKGVAINTLPANVFIDADITLERYHDFTSNSSLFVAFNPSATTDLNCDGIFDELEVSWLPMVGAEEYHLEWTFINDYGPSLAAGYLAPATLPFDFKHNSTRIATTSTSHKITLTFEHGYLLYRVRGIGRDLTNPQKNIVGVWNEDDMGTVSTAAHQYYNTQEHEANKNWQYSATYAEEGKKKEVISYFSGDLRNRQSVTKVNSDKNTIVGETIYDHQGRPAINVLPVPVNDPTCTNETPLKYYPNFNRNESKGIQSYSRIDFDLDIPGFCDTETGAMSIISGASNYYSAANPKKTGAQAFVPDGEKFPFTQIEYTPDNTGRIRRQGGVGPKYQLGKNHETKYFYGWPNQIQLDRLFGSEVGDAAHYKKNLVVDANGQVSVSYLDQEGRTIATALAGNAPKGEDKTTTILAPLTSESSAVKQLTIDLFAKNALGLSSANTPNTAANAIVFNSQLLVAYESEYKFDYTLNITQLTDTCLKAKVCFSCVYDLEIKITDDCGQPVTPMPGTGKQPINKTIGHFTTDTKGNIQFNRNCTGTTPFNHNESFTLNLPIGNYTISKILTVNSAARDFYVSTYLDSLYNSCVKTLHDFQQEALAKIDTASCIVTCASCAKSLQTINNHYYPTVSEARDAYVAAGLGTELEFDYLLEECGAPCKTITWCEATYQQMLLDVSPDGQYAQFQPSIGGQAPDWALSVLHLGNILPKSINEPDPDKLAHWKNPLIKVNGSNYEHYLEENGVRSIIHLAPNGAGNFIPAVDDLTQVKLDPVGNFHYTYPENLTFVQDFVNNWKGNWAKSLVQYHPEYCYYESCVGYSVPQAGYDLTSDGFDALLMVTNTYQGAANAGLILSSYPASPPAQAASDIREMARFVYTSSPSTVKDPFYFSSGINAVNNFQTLNSSTPYSMVEVAAITARCGTNYGATPGQACKSFGKIVGTNAAENKRVLDLEWTLLKNFYLSEKRKVQQKLADAKALTTSCYGFNGCIGDTTYNPFASGMINISGSWLGSPVFDSKQPCSFFAAPFYARKKKRFIGPNDIHSPSSDEMDYQMYLQTGQCPLAIDLQYFITALASRDQLDNTVGEILQSYGEFTNDLYLALSGGTAPGAFIPYLWKATSTSGNVLSGNFVNSTSNTPVCGLVLDKTGSGILNWDDIISISQLKYTTTVGTNYEFSAIAATLGSGGAIVYKPIRGSTCLKITGCIFPPQCDANELARDLSALMSALQVNQELASLSAINLSVPTQYLPFLTPAIKKALGTSNVTLMWRYTGNQYELFDANNTTKMLVIKFTSFAPNTFNSGNLTASVKTFSGIESKYQNFFVVKGMNATNNAVVTINGSVELVNGTTHTGLSMGSCGLPQPLFCQGNEFTLRTDLEALLKDVLLKRPFTGNIDLTQSPYYSSLIQSYFPAGLNGTGSVNPHTAAYTDSLIFSIQSERGECPLLLHHEGARPARYFSNLIGFDSPLMPYGPSSADNNYYRFYIVGIYQVGKTPLKDTIWGESCLPLKICDPCLDGPKLSCVSCDTLSIIPPDTLCQNKALVFRFASKGCNGVPELLWDFGDGTVSSLATHTYTKAGTYTLTLSTIRRPECRGLLTLVTNLKIVVKDCGQPKPLPLPKGRVVLSKVNRPLAPALNSQCEVLYQQYVTAYRAFEIKQKIRRTCKDYKTTSPLYGYEDFVNNGLCSSTEGISLFQNYIQSFTLESPCPGAMPKALIPENPCKSAYNAYLTAINNYNEYIAGHPTIKLPKIVKIINYEEFIAGGFCYCVEGYTAFLQTIIDGTANLSGNREELYWQLDIANTCPPRLKPPCDPPMLQDTFVSPLYVPYTNPCVDYQINLAYTNAANAYQLYLDSLTTWIAAKYNEHCLKAFESFTARYDDKEYHFTLYYYDQAGNLVKTIPPEGVTLVTQAADFQQISKDRTFKQHTFFTDHTMATTYVYNSLNQLVRQSMPDHDLMDIWEYSLPNGLDPRLKVTATQFVNSTKGYLSGYIDMPASSGAPAYTRGYLYTTDNGGTTWTKMNDLLAADLKKVQMLDAFKGFAVGKHGILLKTTDGASWDMVSSGVTTTLNDLYFTTAANGVIIGDNGVVLKTTDAGLNFSSIAAGFMAGMQLNAITYDGTSLYVGAKDANGQGKLYKGVVSNATTPAFAVSWSASNSIRSTDLVKVQMVAGSTSDGYAIGVDGTLLRTSNGGANWTTVPTGLSSNFKKVYFKTPAEGVAILEAVAGQGQIYKTTNSGASWTLISAAGEFYNDFYFYPNTSAVNPPEKGYAVSSDGKVKRIVMSGGYGLVNIVTTPFISSTDKLITVYFSDANRGWVASSTAAYYTSNANSSATTWTQATLPSGISIKKIYFDQTANSGMLLSTTGVLYRIQLAGAIYTFSPLSSAGENYVDFDDNATEVYAFDKTSQRIKKALKSNLAAGLSPFGVPFPATAATNLVSINVQVSNTIYTAGSGGDLFTGSATAWTNNSAQVAPLAICDVQAAGTNTIYAVGNEGTLLQTSNGSDWKTIPTATAVSLNALKFNTTATAPTPATYAGLIAGDKGLLLRSTVSAGQVALAPILVATSENLYDIALNTSNKAYVAGAKGTMVSISNLALSTPLPVLAVQQSADDLWGLCFIPSSTAVYAVGDHAGLYQYNNSSGAKIKALYTPAFRDVHFTNVQNGYIVGDKGSIRYTADGGLNWQYVPFVNASGGTSVPTLNGVWTTEPGKAVIIGNNKYLANATGTTVVYNNIGVGPNLYDVAIKNGKGYLVGANGIVYQTLNNGITWTILNSVPAPNTTLRAIHLFENNMFVAVGDQKKIYCYNGAWISHAAPASVNNSTIFTDVFFHDDRTGYVVGSGGPGIESTVLRCSFPQNIQNSGPTTNEWFVKLLTGVNGVTNPLSVDVVTIDFATRYQGFLGGSFDAGSPSINYARLLNDETNLFSTRFFYDRLGRMVVSQNTKQFNRKSLQTQADFSYTLYDPLGRISEVGELSDNGGTSPNFSTIFGEYVNQKFNPDVINDAKLMAWINASQRREVTKTYYDDTIITGLPIVQENLRKRVATVTYEDLDDKNPQTYQHATHYSYDIHGNVKTVLQDTPALSGIK